MTTIRSLEATILDPIRSSMHQGLLKVRGGSFEEKRLCLLEVVASEFGGFDVEWYWGNLLQRDQAIDPKLVDLGRRTADILGQIQIHPSLALASLATPTRGGTEQRKEGAFHTDFRLAEFLAKVLHGRLATGGKWLDPAVGTGMLLIACVLEAKGSKRSPRSRLLAESIFGADKSPEALRGALLALASLTADRSAIRALKRHLRQGDSLTQTKTLWADVAPDGFDLLVGNPPWEKLKISRHEYLKSQGIDRHYGDEYSNLSVGKLSFAREALAEYTNRLDQGLQLQGAGEVDLYKCFTELALNTVKSSGDIGMLLPAGLIRSQGSFQLRGALFGRSSHLEITVFENRARFFAIDTRMKFLVVHACLGKSENKELVLKHAVGNDASVEIAGSAKISNIYLKKVRPDLTVPEVRSEEEWRLFARMTDDGVRLDDPDGPWRINISRELDMTLNRGLFRREPTATSLPLVEGRMVHQFRFGAKSYKDGTGRKAIWTPMPPVPSKPAPQFWVSKNNLPGKIADRVERPRIGFCDITGQTNERSMLAALVPSGVVCGNKVPTISFDHLNGSAARMSSLWLAIANSFVFDWFLRRVVTTTVNFFVLNSLVFPKIDPDSQAARFISTQAGEVGDGLTGSVTFETLWSLAEKRAMLDVEIATTYGLSFSDVEMVLGDFPLLDRGQPALPHEPASTITRDFLLLRFAQRVGGANSSRCDRLLERVENGRVLGAVPYVPSEFAEGYGKLIAH